MTNREKLIQFLKQSPGSYYCQRCLRGLADLSNPREFKLITRSPAASGAFHCSTEPCSHCGRYVKCVAYILS